MPYDTFPVPLTADYRDPLTLPPEAGQQLTNVTAWRGGLKKAPGLAQLGVQEAFAALPRNFFEAIFPNGARRLIAIGTASFHVYDGASWSANMSGAAGRAVIPAPSNQRYSIVNTLGKVYIAAGGNNNLVVYDQTIAPAGDLVALTGHGVSGVTNLSARIILAFGDRLVLVRTVEDGVDFPTRIRWNSLDAGPVGGFNTALVGAAVREVIESTSEPLTGGFVIGERAFLTKAHEILELIPTDNASSVFSIQSRVSGLGLLSPFSVAVVGNTAFFVGADNVYMFDGNELTPVGDPVLPRIEQQLFFATATEQLYPQGAVYPARDEYHLLTGPEGTAARIFVYDYRKQRWSDRSLSSTTIGMVSGTLLGSGPQTLVVNGFIGRTRTAFVTVEDLTTIANFSTDASFTRWGCVVTTRKLTPKRVGYRGVVEPAATDRVNVLREVRFSSQPNITVDVSVADDGGSGATQTVTTDDGGRGTAYFDFAFQTLAISFSTFNSTPSNAFKLSNVIGYKWTPGGIHLTADPR